MLREHSFRLFAIFLSILAFVVLRFVFLLIAVKEIYKLIIMQECPYGEKCYRKNPIHFGEFSHAHCKKKRVKQRELLPYQYLVYFQF